jgi:hypothetical protein
MPTTDFLLTRCLAQCPPVSWAFLLHNSSFIAIVYYGNTAIPPLPWWALPPSNSKLRCVVSALLNKSVHCIRLFLCVPPRRGRVFYLDKARVQSLTQAAPAWYDWEVVRAGGVRKRGMGKRGRSLAGAVSGVRRFSVYVRTGHLTGQKWV